MHHLPDADLVTSLKATNVRYTNALGKRLNEIRRLENVNTSLLKALRNLEVGYVTLLQGQLKADPNSKPPELAAARAAIKQNSSKTR